MHLLNFTKKFESALKKQGGNQEQILGMFTEKMPGAQQH